MAITTPARYLADHWHGRHRLAWAFWVNLVALRALLSALQEWLAPARGDDYSHIAAPVLALALLFHGVLFAWQAVGVLRATGRYLRAGGPMAPIWGAQLGLILGFFWSLSYAFGAWTMTLPIPDEAQAQAETEAARAAKYSIVPTADGRSLLLNGSLELGITRALADRLRASPQARQIVLNSAGGNIFEARGLNRLIREAGLDTQVSGGGSCRSACTTVFIGGRARSIDPGGRLGFHRYRVDADYAVLNADPAGQQARDRALFLQAGVADWFVDRMFDSAAADMWFPDPGELVAAGVVTAAAPASNVASASDDTPASSDALSPDDAPASSVAPSPDDDAHADAPTSSDAPAPNGVRAPDHAPATDNAPAPNPD